MGYLDNAGLARFWSDIKDVLLGPGSRTSATDDANTVAKGIYYWDLLSRKPLHTPSNVSEGILICIGGNSAVTSRAQFMIPMMNNVGGDNNDTDIFFRIYDRVAGWESWRKFQTTDKYDTSPVANSGDAITSGAVYTALLGKQASLEFDGTYNPDTNPVATVYTAIAAADAVKYGLLGTALTPAVDLDTVNAPGVYYAATGGANFGHLPSDWGSIAALNLYVEQTTTNAASANRMRQILMPAALYPSSHPTSPSTVAPKFYIRYKTGSGSGTWSNWTRFDGAIVAAAAVNGTGGSNQLMGGNSPGGSDEDM